jgi:hypothetical protein
MSNNLDRIPDFLAATRTFLHSLMPTSEFHLFPMLPTEVRHKIWLHVFPPPRYVQILAEIVEEVQGVAHGMEWTEFYAVPLPRSETYAFVPALNGLLQANRESRELIKKSYKPCFHAELRVPIYFNAEKDVLCFDRPESLTSFLYCTHTPTFSDGLQPILFLHGNMHDWAPGRLNAHSMVDSHTAPNYRSRHPLAAMSLASNAKWGCFKEIILAREMVQVRKQTYGLSTSAQALAAAAGYPVDFNWIDDSDDENNVTTAGATSGVTAGQSMDPTPLIRDPKSERAAMGILKHVQKIKAKLGKKPQWGSGNKFLIPKISLMSMEALDRRLSGTTTKGDKFRKFAN